MKYRLAIEMQILKRLEKLISTENINWGDVEELSFELDKIITEKASNKLS